MKKYYSFNPVRAVSTKGKLMVHTIRLLYRARRVLGFPSWKYLVPHHHEDPLHMNLKGALYLGYKYYFKAALLPEKNSGLETHFHNQALRFSIPPAFVPEATITLAAGGDLLPYQTMTPETCRHFWDEAGDYFFNNDIVFANLETPIDTSKPQVAVPEIMLNDMYFNANEETFRIFSGNGNYRGYDVLSTANNHSMDQGEEGLQATMQFLEGKQIKWCGTARSAESRDRICIVEKQGIRIAFIAYTFSLNKEQVPAEKPWLCNHLALNTPNADISLVVHQAAEARIQGADLVVASLHMGCAYQVYPNMHTMHNMRRICEEAGIDIVLGGHPHNMQPLEVLHTSDPVSGGRRQHFIAYSLGDFVGFDIHKWCHLPLLLRLTISRGTLYGKRHVQLTGIEAKPWYLYADKNKSIRLVDFLKVKDDPASYFPEKDVVQEVKELRWFFDEFVFTEKQRHVLAKLVVS